MLSGFYFVPLFLTLFSVDNSLRKWYNRGKLGRHKGRRKMTEIGKYRETINKSKGQGDI